MKTDNTRVNTLNPGRETGKLVTNTAVTKDKGYIASMTGQRASDVGVNTHETPATLNINPFLPVAQGGGGGGGGKPGTGSYKSESISAMLKENTEHNTTTLLN